MKTVDSNYIEMLKNYDSPTICNVIELFRIRPQTDGFLDHSIEALFPDLPPMVGYAVTFTFTSGRERKGVGEYDDIGKQVESLLAVPAPRVVVFQDLDQEPVGASFGEMLAATYMAFGCVGIVTSGGARDTGPIRNRKLPLFARSKNISHGYPQILAVNVPVEVGGVTIKPGELLHGDADGVITIPIDLAPPIAVMCKKYCQAEREWLKYVDAEGATTEDVSAVAAKVQRLIAEGLEETKNAGL